MSFLSKDLDYISSFCRTLSENNRLLHCMEDDRREVGFKSLRTATAPPCYVRDINHIRMRIVLVLEKCLLGSQLASPIPAKFGHIQRAKIK